MKKLSFAIILLLSSVFIAKAQEPVKSAGRQFMQVTTIESVVAGGMGRSRMLITNPDGSQKEMELNNLFSIAGINFKNIKENEDTILKTIKSFTDKGWKLEQVMPLTLSQNDSGAGGIFMTRYLLSKEE